MTRKVAVVGMGHVGATVAHYLVAGGFADDLALYDTNEAKVQADALDLRDAMANLPFHTNLTVNDDSQLADCDVVVSALGKSKLNSPAPKCRWSPRSWSIMVSTANWSMSQTPVTSSPRCTKN